MPTYDYRCDACGHEFEEWQSFTAEKLKKCPSCKKNKLQRLFGSGAAIVFKGSGFYDTDYRQADEKKKAESKKPAAEKPAETSTESKPETKTETKPEAKPEAKTEDSKPKKPAKKAGGSSE
ncbi:MAG: FmdB family zinc ribbon protein [Fimbriiglobus sp.]